MKKKIIFLDGDGTVWYPKKTKWKERPWWIYQDKKTSKNPNFHLILTPTTHSTLRKLKKKGVILILLSTHPHAPKEADLLIRDKVKHFNLDKVLDEAHATKTYYAAKGELILKILKERKISKTKALMIGDHYLWDYKSAKDIGVDALLIDTNYRKLQKNGLKIKKVIPNLSSVLDYI